MAKPTMVEMEKTAVDKGKAYHYNASGGELIVVRNYAIGLSWNFSYYINTAKVTKEAAVNWLKYCG